jgi:IS4 transposase
LVRVVLSTGCVEVLVTSLLDTVAYPAAELGALYHARWRIEEAFDCLSYCTPFVCH